MKKKILRGLAVGAAAFLLVAGLDALGAFRDLEWTSWNVRLHAAASPRKAGRDIALLAIDQDSLDVYEKQQALPWPWPRELYAAVVEYLRAGGAKAVVFDLIFSETSRFGVDDDAAFGRAAAAAGNVFLPVFLSRSPREVDDAKAASVALRYNKARPGMAPPARMIQPLASATLPVDALTRTIRGLGNVQFEPDRDSVYRALPLFFSVDGMVVPSLPAAVTAFVKPGYDFGKVPLDARGRMVLRYRGPAGTYKTWSIAAIVNSQAQIAEGQAPQVPPVEFRDKIVIVGGTAPGLLDYRPSPFGDAYPGMEILATALDNLLRKDFVRTAPRAAAWAWMLLVAVAVGVGASLPKKAWHVALVFPAALALPTVPAAAGIAVGLWWPFAAPAFAAAGAYVGAALLSYGIEGAQRRFIKNVFKHYLSPHVIDRILRDPSLLKLGGERREITAFFSDVAGFTTVSEKLAPEELSALLNEYLSAMTDIILDEGGTLDKYEGDAIIAFWNAPLDQPDHAARACRAALRCQETLTRMGPHFRERYGHELRMRIGLNSGPVAVGNMGSTRRFDYTALGDTMNLASRLEGACKAYGICLLAGPETRERAADGFAWREVDRLRVVGKREPVRVFELVGERGALDAPSEGRLEAFGRALEAYRSRDFGRALDLFRGGDGDPVASVYAGRCERFLQEPPPADWDGVFELKVK